MWTRGSVEVSSTVGDLPILSFTASTTRWFTNLVAENRTRSSIIVVYVGTSLCYIYSFNGYIKTPVTYRSEVPYPTPADLHAAQTSHQRILGRHSPTTPPCQPNWQAAAPPQRPPPDRVRRLSNLLMTLCSYFVLVPI